ncbi:MAG: hypothetical protein AAFY09_12775 [Pseudomonadota bacterium]
MTAQAQNKRGWVQIYPSAGGGFDVYDWTEFMDSGYLIGNFTLHEQAVDVALQWAEAHGRKFETAEIIDFSSFKRGVA